MKKIGEPLNPGFMLQPLADRLERPFRRPPPSEPIKPLLSIVPPTTPSRKELPISRLTSQNHKFPYDVFSAGCHRRSSAGYSENPPMIAKPRLKRVTSIPDISSALSYPKLEPLSKYMESDGCLEDMINLKKDCTKIMEDSNMKPQNYMSFLPNIKKQPLRSYKHGSASPIKSRRCPFETEEPSLQSSTQFLGVNSCPLSSPQSLPEQRPQGSLGSFADEVARLSPPLPQKGSQIANLELLASQIQKTGSITFNLNQNFYFSKPNEMNEGSPRIAVRVKPVIRKAFSSQVKASAGRTSPSRIPKVFLETLVQSSEKGSRRTVDAGEGSGEQEEMRRTAYFKCKAAGNTFEECPKRVFKYGLNKKHERKKSQYNFLSRLEENMKKCMQGNFNGTQKMGTKQKEKLREDEISMGNVTFGQD